MSTALAIRNEAQELVRQSTDIAGLCREIVVASSSTIQGRKYVRVEGWMAIATAHGCVASARDVQRVDGGIRATGEIRKMHDGTLIATAEGFVGEDEPTWFGGDVVQYGKTKTLPKRPEYAIRAMAQTRAISRACRSCFAHVVVLMDAGLQTTPAEEVPMGGFNVDELPLPLGHQRPPDEWAKGNDIEEIPKDPTDEEKRLGNIAKLQSFIQPSRPKGMTVNMWEQMFCDVAAAAIGHKIDGVGIMLDAFNLEQLRTIYGRKTELLAKLQQEAAK